MDGNCCLIRWSVRLQDYCTEGIETGILLTSTDWKFEMDFVCLCLILQKRLEGHLVIRQR